MDDVWRCNGCGKTKDLHGPHLNGKNSVRSDCWPCAKKQTFTREAAATSNSSSVRGAGKSEPSQGSSVSATSAPAAASAPFLYTTTATTAAGSVATVPPSSHNPFLLGTDTVASVGTFASAFTAVNTGNNVKSAAGVMASSSFSEGSPTTPPQVPAASTNPFLSKATALAATTSAGAGSLSVCTASTAPATAAAPAGSRSPLIVMEKRAGISPPFTFKAVTPFAASDPVFADPNSLLPSSNIKPASPFGTATFSSPTSAPASLSTAAGWPSNAKRDAAATSTAQKPAASSAGVPKSPHSLSAAPSAITFPSPAGAGATATPEYTWICSECKKAKNLDGPHLAGKTSIRSDCWPCGKKRLFILVNRAELSRRSPSASASRPPAAGGSLSPLVNANPSATPNPANTTREASKTPEAAESSEKSSGAVPPSPAPRGASTAPEVAKGQPSSNGEQAVSQPEATRSWCVPVIPPNEAVTDFYLFPEDTYDDLASEAVFSPAALEQQPSGTVALGLPAAVATVTITASQRMQALFNAQLLHSFRLRIVESVPLCAAWFGSVLYVIAEEPPTSTLRLLADGNRASVAFAGGQERQRRLLQDGNRAYEMMGRFAALLMAVESKLATSRFRRMRRLFCASPFSFAASCCYAAQFVPSHGNTSSSPDASSASTDIRDGNRRIGSPDALEDRAKAAGAPFTVYGPSPDITTAPTIWDRVVASYPLAVPCVVSVDQRIRAAQQLYRRVSWLAMPADMSGAAIQLLREDADKESSYEETSEGRHLSTITVGGEGKKAETRAALGDGVDVVLLPGTMRLEDLPAASVLALPVKQF